MLALYGGRVGNGSGCNNEGDMVMVVVMVVAVMLVERKYGTRKC